MALTGKQENFCIKYNKCGNATESYKHAYNCVNSKPATINNKAYALLKRGDIRARLDELNKAAVDASVMSKQEALTRLTQSARFNINDIAEFRECVVGQDENGADIKETIWRIKNSDEIHPHAMSAIKSVTATKTGPKLEMHDPHNAIKQLSDILGWNAPVKSLVEVSEQKTLDDFYIDDETKP